MVYSDGPEASLKAELQDCFDAVTSLRKEMDAWAEQTGRLDPPGQQGGGEDEANYALSFFPHYLVTGNPLCRELFDGLLEELSGWVDGECVHGYEPVAEAHHGPEPFILFLSRFLGLFPESEAACSLIAGAAQHVGNWCDGVPDWYDWERDRFYGYHLGTEKVGGEPETANELAEHFRFLHLALAAYKALGEERYLEWALRYGRKRAERLIDLPAGPLPVMWNSDGDPVWEQDLLPAQRGMSAVSHHVSGDPLIGVEVLLASGAIHALGDLFRVSGDSIYQEAAHRIVDPLVSQLADPFADPGAAAISFYRRAFGEPSLDPEIEEQIDRMPEPEMGEMMMLFPEIYRRRESGIGRRADMIAWAVRKEGTEAVSPTQEPSTAALTLAYQVTGDVEFATRAITQAGRRLKMARRVLRGGREHSDMGGAVCSVAAGHGRNWGTGAVTGCYGHLLLGADLSCGMFDSLVSVRSDAGSGLPESLLSLVRPGPGDARVTFYNGCPESATFRWSFGEEQHTEILGAGEEASRSLLEAEVAS